MARKTAKARAGGTRRRRALCKLDDKFSEWRFEPVTTSTGYGLVAALCGAGLALGAGLYATWLRDAELAPLAYAPYLLAAGAVLLVAYLMLAQRRPVTLRVGDLGLAVERDGRLQRYRWYQIEEVEQVDDGLRVLADGRPIVVPLREHAAAARRLLEQATRRIPQRVHLDDEQRQSLGAPASGEGQRGSAEPPQVAGESCLASGEPLTFEQDVRMCRRCGALYHRRGVPRRCAACGKKLKSG